MTACEPMITTIIPTYRRPQLLRRAIKSVLAQTYPHFQVCVYDNASGDETASVVQELAAKDGRVKYHCHEQNIGALRNFIYGFDRVETPFFCALGDDDALLPGFFEMALAGFHQHPEAACSVCGAIYVNNQGRFMRMGASWPAGFHRPPEAMLALLDHGWLWQGMLFRREALEATGGLDGEGTGPACDLDFLMRLASRRAFVARPEPAAVVRMDEGVYSYSGQVDNVFAPTMRMIRKIEADEGIPAATRARVVEWLRSYMKRSTFFVGRKSVAVGDWRNVRLCAAALEQEFRCKFEPAVLRKTADLCNFCPPLGYCLRLGLGVRRAFLRLWRLPADRKHRPLIKLAGV